MAARRGIYLCIRGGREREREREREKEFWLTYPSSALFLRMRGRGEEFPWLGDIVRPGELPTPTPGPCDNDPVTWDTPEGCWGEGRRRRSHIKVRQVREQSSFVVHTERYVVWGEGCWRQPAKLVGFLSSLWLQLAFPQAVWLPTLVGSIQIALLKYSLQQERIRMVTRVRVCNYVKLKQGGISCQY